jgi:signal transduction histidine kinase
MSLPESATISELDLGGLPGGEMSARIRDFDWSSSPLGPIDEWPSSLREAVSLCLLSRFQLAIYWGPHLVLLYNDAERDVLGAMHPRALGRPAAEILADMWDVVGPMLHGVLETGDATWSVDQALRLNRRGFVEEAFFTYSYSAIPDGDSIGGVLLVTFETTERVLAERRLRTLRELAAETAKARNTEEVCARAAGVLAGNRSDVPFSLLFLTEPDGRMRLCASTGVASTPDPGPWPLREVAITQEARRVEDVAARLSGGETPLPRAAIVLPIAQAEKGSAAGCLVVGVSDFRPLDEAYRSFLDLVAGQIASAIAGVRVLEEERRRAEALAAFDATKTAFFANVSHEFRTPLTLLLAPLEDTLAQTGSALRAADRERLTIAHRNGLRLLKLVNMLLEFSRIEADRVQAVREPTDLAAFTAELEQRIAERTRELFQANARLQRQIAKRQRIEEARRELLHRLVHAQEEEHRRIARELHDDLTQRLAVLAIDAGTFERTPGCAPDIADKAREMRDQLMSLSEAVHSLSRQLHPSILDDLGLSDALRSECLILGKRDGITVTYHAQDVPTDLPRDVALCIYRVAQEALRNIARHAQAPRAAVRLVANEQELVLCVRDWGVGFEVAASGKTKVGLESMRERARLIKAHLTVHSRRGKGTRITMRVPMYRRQP